MGKSKKKPWQPEPGSRYFVPDIDKNVTVLEDLPNTGNWDGYYHSEITGVVFSAREIQPNMYADYVIGYTLGDPLYAVVSYADISDTFSLEENCPDVISLHGSREVAEEALSRVDTTNKVFWCFLRKEVVEIPADRIKLL